MAYSTVCTTGLYWRWYLEDCARLSVKLDYFKKYKNVYAICVFRYLLARPGVNKYCLLLSTSDILFEYSLVVIFANQSCIRKIPEVIYQ